MLEDEGHDGANTHHGHSNHTASTVGGRASAYVTLWWSYASGYSLVLVIVAIYMAPGETLYHVEEENRTTAAWLVAVGTLVATLTLLVVLRIRTKNRFRLAQSPTEMVVASIDTVLSFLSRPCNSGEELSSVRMLRVEMKRVSMGVALGWAWEELAGKLMHYFEEEHAVVAAWGVWFVMSACVLTPLSLQAHKWLIAWSERVRSAELELSAIQHARQQGATPEQHDEASEGGLDDLSTTPSVGADDAT